MKKIKFMTKFCALFFAFIFSALAASAERVDYAIVVGINEYEEEKKLSKLQYAEKDAKVLAKYLKAQGFEVHLLLGSEGNSTKDKIFNVISEIGKRLDTDDRFVFSFSGHGETKTFDGVKLGYLLTNGPKGSSQLSAEEIRLISDTLGKARHQLFIFASCYGGLLGQLPKRSKAFDSEEFLIESLDGRISRQYISAGDGDQQVLDSGPAGLSWFSYFLMKGLEQGVAVDRANGMLTFAEWASYVQAYSANPYHTPSFGTLYGDEGGQFLLKSTSFGKPVLPKLPSVSARVLEELGFFRGSDLSVQDSLQDMKQPIDNLFRSWSSLNFDDYMDQFDRSVVQTGKYKSGSTYERDYQEIYENRKSLFPQLLDVSVVNYEIMFQGLHAGRKATFGVRYSMTFNFKNGRVVTEKNIKECYTVQRTGSSWLIVSNNDYQGKICEG